MSRKETEQGGTRVAGDIIRTDVVAPTLNNVFILGLNVFIRTSLNLALQLELEGTLPWQRRKGRVDLVLAHEVPRCPHRPT